MIVVLADTHCTEPPALTSTLREYVTSAGYLLHAGDFTTMAVVDAFDALADNCIGVVGNADAAAVGKRLPATAQLTYDDTRIVLTHHIDGGVVGRRLFGRAHDAAVVITGHTHRSAVSTAGTVRLLNPGSHNQPRGGPPTFAVLEPEINRGRVLTTDGNCIEEFPIQPPLEGESATHD